MQRLGSLIRAVAAIGTSLTKSVKFQTSIFDAVKNTPGAGMLTPHTPILNLVCGLKIKGRVRRRCKSCYFVVRDERLYVMCPKFPRHKQMAMKPKPHNTWILTHASQSRVRPW